MEFKYAPMFQLGKDTTEYYRLGTEGISVGEFEGHQILKVAPEALTALANAAFRDVNFLLRPAHNEQVAKILNDPEASSNDKYVALRFLRNAEVAAKGQLPVRTQVQPLFMERKVSRSGQDMMMLKLCQRAYSKHIRRKISGTVRMLLLICIKR